MNIIKSILQKVSSNYYFYKIAKKIVSYHNNDNNADIATNGEGNFLEKHIKEFDIIFDVGANIGDWSAVANKLNGDAKIYAFEPFKGSFDVLKNRKFTNGNVYSNLSALSDKVGDFELFYNKNQSSLNSFYKRDIDNCDFTDKVIVEVNTVDNFCLTHGIESIDFLKIDVEGNEFKTILGAEKMVTGQKIKTIQFEYGGTYIGSRTLLKDIFNFFKDKNYSIYKIYSNNIRKIEKYNEELETFQYSNFLAILNK